MAYKLARHSRWKILVIITPSYKLPEELKEEVGVLYCPKPDEEEIDALLERVAGNSRALSGVRDTLRDKKSWKRRWDSPRRRRKTVFRKAIVASRGRVDGVLC